MNVLRFGNSWLAWNNNLISMPDSLYAYIVNAFSNGWDRNRAIDTTGGANNNALMGGYLLAASNTTISIPGIRVTNQDTIVALTPNGLVGTVAVTGTMTFVTGQSYGAFEVYRAGARIGRFCITERTGLGLINQHTGADALPNGLIGGTTTTVWQRSNTFYCETNHSGYSVAGTGWVTNAGEAIAVGSIVPADLVNPTKCLAWVGGVQQDLQFVGRAKNSVSVVPISHYFNGDRYYVIPAYGATVTQHKILVYAQVSSTGNTGGVLYGVDSSSSNTRRVVYIDAPNKRIQYGYYVSGVALGNTNIIITDASLFDIPIMIEGGFDGNNIYLNITDLRTGRNVYGTASYTASSLIIGSFNSRVGTSPVSSPGRYYTGYIGYLREEFNNTVINELVFSQHANSLYNIKPKTTVNVLGVSTNILQNIDLVYNVYNTTGYELWTNGTDYQIYPLASDGTRFITPAGYTIVETVTAGNVPSVADSRFTTFRYTLANSCVLRNSVPEAYNADAQATPKMLTYAELSALTSNIKVTKTEVNGKITNITIRQ